MAGVCNNIASWACVFLRKSDAIWEGSYRNKMAAIFADDIPQFIRKEKIRIFIRISLKFVPDGPVDNESSLVRVMVWRLVGAKPLPEPMTQRTTHNIAYARAQWVDSSGQAALLVNGFFRQENIKLNI